MSGRESVLIIVAWVVVDSIGLCFMLGALRYALQDRAWLKRNHLNGPRRILANHDVRDEVIRVAMQLAFVVVGVARLFLPFARPHQTIPLTLGEWIYEIAVNVVFLLIPMLMTAQSMFAYRDRHQVLQRLPARGPRRRRVE